MTTIKVERKWLESLLKHAEACKISGDERNMSVYKLIGFAESAKYMLKKYK